MPRYRPCLVHGRNQRGLVHGRSEYTVGVLAPEQPLLGRLTTKDKRHRGVDVLRIGHRLQHVVRAQPHNVGDFIRLDARSLGVSLNKLAGVVVACGHALELTFGARVDNVGGADCRVIVGRAGVFATVGAGCAGEGNEAGTSVDNEGASLRWRANVQVGMVGAVLGMQRDRYHGGGRRCWFWRRFF